MCITASSRRLGLRGTSWRAPHQSHPHRWHGSCLPLRRECVSSRALNLRGARIERGGTLTATSLPDREPHERMNLILPEAFDDEEVRARPPRRVASAVRTLGLGLALIAVGYWPWHLLQVAGASGAAAPSVGARSRLEGLADTLEQVVGAYRTRAQFFERQQMTCDDLAQGLVRLDDQWLRYSLEHRAQPDAIASSRDEALAARVAEAERQFSASGCSRP